MLMQVLSARNAIARVFAGCFLWLPELAKVEAQGMLAPARAIGAMLILVVEVAVVAETAGATDPSGLSWS